MNHTFLCHKNEVPTDGCKGISLPDKENKVSDDRQVIFIVNRGDFYFAYKNSCPHTGASLNWQPDIFLDFDNFYIQCAIHAARFEVESGLCVWGPCVNQSLQKIKLEIIDERIYSRDSL